MSKWAISFATSSYEKLHREKFGNPFQKNTLLPIVLSALLLRAGDFSFNLSIGKGFTAITGPIGGASPVLFALLAFMFFKERPSKQQLTGICITLVGIFLLAMNTI